MPKISTRRRTALIKLFESAGQRIYYDGSAAQLQGGALQKLAIDRFKTIGERLEGSGKSWRIKLRLSVGSTLELAAMSAEASVPDVKIARLRRAISECCRSAEYRPAQDDALSRWIAVVSEASRLIPAAERQLRRLEVADNADPRFSLCVWLADDWRKAFGELPSVSRSATDPETFMGFVDTVLSDAHDLADPSDGVGEFDVFYFADKAVKHLRDGGSLPYTGLSYGPPEQILLVK